MSQCLMMLSSSVFFRLLAHAPEELQRRAKDDARRAIPALCFTEDDIRQKFMQEELWETMSGDERREAIRTLLDAEEYQHVRAAANEAIADAVGRYLYETLIKRVDDHYEWEDDPDPPGWPDF
jgi:hypothetical protein